MAMAAALVTAAAAAAAALLLSPAAHAHSPQPELELLSSDVLTGAAPRRGRIFNFNTTNKGIRMCAAPAAAVSTAALAQVELGFAIPLLYIPVGRPTEDGALVELNLAALAGAGVFTAAAAIFIPKLFDGFTPEFTYSRSDDKGIGAVLSRMDSVLRQHQVDAGSCVQRAVCSLVGSALSNVKRGTGGSMDKIVDGIASSEWLWHTMRGIGIDEAVASGRNGSNCTDLYASCSTTQRKLKKAAANLAKEVYS